jgi:hypothetical protein
MPRGSQRLPEVSSERSRRRGQSAAPSRVADSQDGGTKSAHRPQDRDGSQPGSLTRRTATDDDGAGGHRMRAGGTGDGRMRTDTAGESVPTIRRSAVPVAYPMVGTDGVTRGQPGREPSTRRTGPTRARLGTTPPNIASKVAMLTAALDSDAGRDQPLMPRRCHDRGGQGLKSSRLG